ncbi:MAG TPA: hypothetical protein VL860_02250 [Planctomycetota bacterium]|nr:hypothetical protein [Planctomycetota bacterium]
MEGLVAVAVASFFAFVISYLSNWLWRIKGEKAVFSNRLQFEKEFDIYQRLWADLVDVAQAAEAGNRAALDDAQHRARDAVFKFSPFYEASVYEGAKKVLATAAESPIPTELLRRQMDQVSASIKARIWPTA